MTISIITKNNPAKSDEDTVLLSSSHITHQVKLDDMLLYVGKIFNVTPTELRALIPKRFKRYDKYIQDRLMCIKVFQDAADKYNETLNDKHISPEFKNEILIIRRQNDRRLRESTEEMANLIPNDIKTIALTVLKLLQHTASDSHQQMFSKTQVLQSKLAVAERIYLSDPVNIAQKRLIDLKIWKESEGDEEAIAIISDYWNQFSGEESITYHQLGENLLKNLFITFKSSIKQSIRYLQTNRKSLPMEGVIFNLPGKLNSHVQTSFSILIDQFTADLQQLEGANPCVLRYFHFKANKLLISVANNKVRCCLEVDKMQVESEFDLILHKRKWDLKKKIYKQVANIRFETYKMEYLTGAKPKPIIFTDEEFQQKLENRVELLKEISLKLEDAEKIIVECSRDVEKDNLQAFARKKINEDASFYPEMIAKYTMKPSESQILAYYKHVCHSTILDILLKSQSQPSLDLFRLDDPMQRLLSQLKVFDDQRLTLPVGSQNSCQIL